MKNNKIIKLVVIVIILIIVALNIFLVKNDTEEFLYSDILANDNILSNTSNYIIKEESIEKIKVYVTGEVVLPGVIELEEDARIEDAIRLAGGVTEYANLAQVNLAYPLEDGQKLYIPSINDKVENEYISTENGEKVVESAKSTSNKVNINKGDLESLKTLPRCWRFTSTENNYL